MGKLMKGNGRMGKRMVMEFKFIIMEKDMKEIGRVIREKDKENYFIIIKLWPKASGVMINLLRE
jgi:hypothetical protein